jgi:hypothetical protein
MDGDDDAIHMQSQHFQSVDGNAHPHVVVDRWSEPHSCRNMCHRVCLASDSARGGGIFKSES